MEKGVSVIIPTYNGGKIFSQCLEKIGEQDYKGRVQLIVIDSGSTDGTAELAEDAGAFVKRIDKRRFHHAKTRNEALLFAKFDKVVYTVQDAIPCSNTWLSDLEKSLCENDVVAAYTNQVPHDDADPYARFEIECINNFRGRKPVIQGLESPESFRKMPYEEAYRSIGLNNVCAIYRKKLLMNTPFPEVDFAEDIAWAFKNMLLGHKVLYQPDIKVRHSHNRLPEYAFNRQVVNSFWCAKIMNRVRDDVSFLTIADLLTLTSGVRRFVDQLRSEILAGSKAPNKDVRRAPHVIDKVMEKYSLTNRVRRFLINNLSKNSNLRSPQSRKIGQQINDEIKRVLEYIKRNYNVSVAEELLGVLELIAANVLGRIYGEVYASRMLSGETSSRFQAFMRPYMKGI